MWGPAAAERAIQLDDRGQLLLTESRQLELALEEAALRVEHLQVVVDAAFVALPRQPRRGLERLDEPLLFGALLGGPALAGQRVGDVAQRDVDRALVAHDQFTLDRLRVADVGAGAA